MDGSLRCRVGMHAWAESEAMPAVWGRPMPGTWACTRCERPRSAAFGRLRCAVGAHAWQQRDDPDGIAHGPVVIYSRCTRCERERRNEISAGPSAPERPGRGPGIGR